MKSIIIYYSLTGNTKKVAKAIYQGLSELSEKCDIVKMKELDAGQLNDYDLIGLGSPVWGGVPPHVRQFIDALPSLKGKHAFAFATSGCLPEFFFRVIEMLEKKELTFIGIRHWYGTVYLPGLPKPYITDGHPDDIDLREAKDFGREMAELSLRVRAEGPQAIPKITVPEMAPPNPNPRPIPTFHEEKCRYPECRLCMDNCPLEGIDLSVSPPVFGRPCNSCQFCEMICPEGAIELDYEPIAKASTQRMKDVYLERMEKAEAEGRFRRLVPAEKIGWDTPFYKVYNRHPRYVIPEE